MTRILNFWAGPGAGKSTAAAYVYAQLKAAGQRAELVREYVKAWAWDGRVPRPTDQLYFLGKQLRAESMLLGRVDWIVTDSPVGLVLYYTRRHAPAFADAVRESIVSYYRATTADRHEHFHVLLRRATAYDPAGRWESEADALEADAGLAKILFGVLKVQPFVTPPDFNSLDYLLTKVLLK